MMIRSGKQQLLALIFVPFLCANIRPASTRQELLAKSDLVILGRVMAVHLPPPPADPVRLEDDTGGVDTFDSFASSPCVRVAVEREVKGTAARSVIVCSSIISENNPRPLRLGKRYSMFLTRAGTVYVATSWDGVTRLP
ncbi:MAG: hypothetical protein ACXWIR_03710 [Croceibacterium sp.]